MFFSGRWWLRPEMKKPSAMRMSLARVRLMPRVPLSAPGPPGLAPGAPISGSQRVRVDVFPLAVVPGLLKRSEDYDYCGNPSPGFSALIATIPQSTAVISRGQCSPGSVWELLRPKPCDYRLLPQSGLASSGRRSQAITGERGYWSGVLRKISEIFWRFDLKNRRGWALGVNEGPPPVPGPPGG